MRVDGLTAACGRFLALLPECSCGPERLARALSRFELGPRAVDRAAAVLPEHYELELRGVRLLISEYLSEFCRCFNESGVKTCEVSVPSPQFLIMYLQSAVGSEVAFRTNSLFIQIVLRSFFLFRKPFEPELTHMRLCGLNRARHRLMHTDVSPELVIQFGVLCDECTKCCEGEDCHARILNVSFPKGTLSNERCISATVENFLSTAANTLRLKPGRKDWIYSLGTYMRLAKAEKNLAKLNSRKDFRPLDGNSFALAQTVELAVFSDWSGILTALETLVHELKTAAPDDGLVRAYCYYTPFLYPWVDTLCRKHGIRLMGSAVFLNDVKYTSLTPGAMTTGWLNGMNVRKNADAEAVQIALDMSRSNSSAYITGLFDFDRWLGPSAASHANVLSRRGIPVFALHGDFWCERAGPSCTEMETVCALITRT